MGVFGHAWADSIYMYELICMNYMYELFRFPMNIKSQFDPSLYLEILDCQEFCNLTDQEHTHVSLTIFNWNLYYFFTSFLASSKGKKPTSFFYPRDVADLSFWSILDIARHGRSGEVVLISVGHIFLWRVLFLLETFFFHLPLKFGINH